MAGIQGLAVPMSARLSRHLCPLLHPFAAPPPLLDLNCLSCPPSPSNAHFQWGEKYSVRQIWFKFSLCLLLARWPWASNLTSLSFSLLIDIMEITTSLCGCERCMGGWNSTEDALNESRSRVLCSFLQKKKKWPCVYIFIILLTRFSPKSQ